MANIVIVAREGEVFEFLGYILNKEGHEVRLLRDMKVISPKMRGFVPQLVILESGGLIANVEATSERIRSWRNFRSVRILAITAESQTTGTSEPCVGADAVLARPLHPRAVLAQVKRLLGGKSIIQTHRKIAVGNLVLDPSSYRVIRSGRVLEFSLREFRLLYFLVSHPNTFWSREHLLTVAWTEGQVTPRTVDVFIRRLRKHIENDPNNPVLLLSVRGEGYGFHIPPEPLDEKPSTHKPGFSDEG